MGLPVLTKGKQFHVLSNFLKVGVYQGIFSRMYLDDFKLDDNDKKNGIIPELLVDGYGSSLDLGFLK